MAESVECRQEDISDDLNGVDSNLELLLDSNRFQKPFGSKSENLLMPAIAHGQDPLVADDLLNSENIMNYNSSRNPLPALELEEHEYLTSHSLISNGQSTSPDSRLEKPRADISSTTNVVPKLLPLSSNCIESCYDNVRCPSPSRKAPSTTRSTLPLISKSLRSSTPTSRATVASTKPFAPSKRSITPTPRSSTRTTASKPTSRSSTPTPVVAASKSTLRSSTPTPIKTFAKSVSRSSTPTQRPSIIAAAKSAPRSSTPTQRPSIIAAAKSASRSSTPTQRPSGSVNGNRSCSETKTRGSSPSVHSRPSKTPPSLPNAKLTVIETNMKAAPKRTSCSPSQGLVSNGGSLKSGITRSRGYINVNDQDVNPVLMGTKMVERVVNMRKLAPPRQEQISNQNYTSGKLSVTQDNSGFGRSLSKKSFDMALRHLDIRRSMPGNMRAMITKVPASSASSVRAEPTKTQTISTSDSPRATSNSASSGNNQ